MTERYEIIKLIAKDPAGGRYLAEDSMLGRKVVFRHIDAEGDGMQQESWAKEFSVFAGKLCALQHPNLFTIYDVDVDEDGVSMVTQFIDEKSLSDHLKEGALPQISVYRMANDLLEALHAAHSSGVFHGALHAGSITRVPRAAGGHRYFIVDLGLNKLATMVKGKDVQIADPVLLAPELHDGTNEPDALADLFMVGQLCYTALAGGHPFAGESPEQCVASHMAGELTPLKDFAPDVQADFEAWVMHLAKGDRSQRPASMEDAMAALHAIKIHEPLPDVAAQVQAVTPTTAVQVVTPTTAVQVVAPAEEEAPAASVMDPAKKSNKKGLVMIGVLCLLIGIVLVVGLNRGDQRAGVDGHYSEVPEGVWVHLHETLIVNTIEKNDDPVEVNLDTEKTLDWNVFTAPRAKKEMPKGKYIRTVMASGKFKGVTGKESGIHFATGGGKAIPLDVTNAAKAGDGWQILLLVPKAHRGSMIVTFYMLQSQCDFHIEVTGKSGDKPLSKDVKATESGVVKIPLELPKPKGGQGYNIKITAQSIGSKEGFAMGLNAIHVGRR
ncbi:MAG: hypothetical protein KJO21_13400 [Verrucomicrobiae bacterium]|nr:hypothetical protein [Verrucomicrobiae bacterium]NNJ44315.1 hypothetical protein [Akkermansiaceae bacterium]